MLPNYFSINGNFEKEAESIIFHGSTIKRHDLISGQEITQYSYGDFLLENDFKVGKICFDVTFSDVVEDTRCGVLFNYMNNNSRITFYAVGIRNALGKYSLEYYDGKDWSFPLLGGERNTLRASEKYSITMEIFGSNVLLYINGIRVFSYSNIEIPSGAAGIYIMNGSDAIIDNIRVLRKRPTAFAIMKFEKDFDDLYNNVIVPKCMEYGYEPIRADRIYTSSSIIQDIITEISDASVIIADITMDNPNVFYELGYAHALNKPTILLADVDKRKSLPFDLSGFRTILYSNSIGGKKDIEEMLEKYLYNIS